MYQKIPENSENIGEERVPFVTLVPFIPRLPSPSDLFPARIQNGDKLLLLNENALKLLFGRRESR